MCDSVIFEDNSECETQGELKRALRLRSLAKYSEFKDTAKDDSCLCPIDLKALAEDNGYTCSSISQNGEYDPFKVWFYEKGV